MKKIFIILLSLILTGGIAGSALAYVNQSWEWHKAGGKAKRTLHYCAGTAVEYTNEGRVLEIEKAKAGLPENWGLWLTEAIEKWNEADSGWKFEPVEFNIPPCQVVIVLADFNEAATGGGLAKVMDTDNDGKADLALIAIDKILEETLKDLPDDQDIADGERDGWSAEGNEQTRDPVGVLAHELGHALRLAHHPDSRHSDLNDPDLTDPRNSGDHQTDLSNEDIIEAQMSAKEEANFPNFRPCVLKNNFDYLGVEISFDHNSFKDMNDMSLRILSGVAIPEPITLEGGYSHIIDNSAIWFKTELLILKPLSVSIPYSDEDLIGGDSKWIGDYHGLVPPALDESTLAVFKYVEEPFGVYAEGSSHWEKIDEAAFSVDAENNKVTFQTMEAGTYGLSAKPKAGEITIDDQIAGKTAKAGKEAKTRILNFVLGGLVILAGLGGLAYILKPQLAAKK